MLILLKAKMTNLRPFLAEAAKSKQLDFLIKNPGKKHGDTKKKQQHSWSLILLLLLLCVLLCCGVALCGLIMFITKWTAENRELLIINAWEPAASRSASQCWQVEDRVDCFPMANATQGACQQRGCCWRAPEEMKPGKLSHLGIPYCFYSPTTPSYSLLMMDKIPGGFSGLLQRQDSVPVYPDPVKLLRITVSFESASRLRVKITDAENERYEVPVPVLCKPPKGERKKKELYDFRWVAEPFSWRVVRKSNGQQVFNTAAGALAFYDQFLEMSSYLPTRFIYGLGEHSDRLLHKTDYQRFTFFATDVQPGDNMPLYGAHPFYLSMEDDGQSNGVFLFNSNPMDIILSPSPAITYRTIGGILDFYIFLGPTPKDVVADYISLIGKPSLPPYWALGFHLCKYGYGSLERTQEVMERNIAAGIPLDVQWNDIDYMSASRDFTLNTDTFSELPEFLESLHNRSMHYVIITDPGISAVEAPGTYPPFDDGVAMDCFVKNASGDVLLGQVWTGARTAFPDFTHANAVTYWSKQISEFHDRVAFDGLWIDMNEPANFVDGSVYGCPVESPLESPPYLPHMARENGFLRSRSICMTAQQNLGLHYNLHNLYGLTEAITTQAALLETLPNKRPFIISRSTFAGQGRYSGHWSGDIPSTWEAMQRSIPNMLNFNMFGIPLVGADICGFNGNTTEELCQRWQELGAFYPFSRNHNSLGNSDQDPAAFGPAVVASTRQALLMRYRLLPYYNSLFFRAGLDGGTVVRPVFFEFPLDRLTYEIDWQFLVGGAIMVSPVLTENTTEIDAYFPAVRWYDFETGREVASKGEWVTLEAPAEKINVHVRGGFIVPTQAPSVTTADTRQNPFTLLVALDKDCSARGELFWDEGEEFDVLEGRNYSVVEFALKKNALRSKVTLGNFRDIPRIGEVVVFGMASEPVEVALNGVPVDWSFKDGVLVVPKLNAETLVVFQLDFDL